MTTKNCILYIACFMNIFSKITPLKQIEPNGAIFSVYHLDALSVLCCKKWFSSFKIVMSDSLFLGGLEVLGEYTSLGSIRPPFVQIIRTSFKR